MRRKRRGRGAALARPGLTPERLRSDLLELTRNLRWSWSAEARFCLAAVAGRLAPAREEEFLRNPFAGVRCLRARDFANLAADPGIYPRVHAGAMAALRRALAPARPPRGLDPRRPVAY
ncbi:MAG: hypothetical protein HY721_03555, partial [Planctomycetes bacterium]|nr:hypothetical protein [Planctomycetota bacterium]